jgi:hypothetical protein
MKSYTEIYTEVRKAHPDWSVAECVEEADRQATDLIMKDVQKGGQKRRGKKEGIRSERKTEG